MTAMCGKSFAIFKREFKSYFEAPVAYVFLVAFLLLTGFFTFSMSHLYERNVADMQAFFVWMPWVFLALVPAATMGLWAEERRSGTIELLLTMPVTMLEAILGKFFAAWAFISLAVALTFPTALTVAYLGKPDVGVILCQYAGTILMAGAYVSIGMLTSSMTRSQVIGFILSLLICLVMILAGWEPVTDLFVHWAPASVVDFVASLSFMPHFTSISRGVVDIRDVAYYISVIVFMAFATHIVIENRKSA
jgi:ABC-2 type transport system permease protein